MVKVFLFWKFKVISIQIFIIYTENAISVKNGSFSWGDESETFLKNINLSVQQKSLDAIVGTVGSGKSTLIASLLGETEKMSGSVNTYGSLAYVPQQAWMLNASLKVNLDFPMLNN